MAASRTRTLLIGMGGLMLVMLLMDDTPSGASGPSWQSWDLRQQAALKNECMKELSEVAAPIKSKFNYCDCVLEKVGTELSKNEDFKTKVTAFLSIYSQNTADPRKLSRALASTTQERFFTSSLKLNILLARTELRYSFEEMNTPSEELAKSLDVFWSQARTQCVSP